MEFLWSVASHQIIWQGAAYTKPDLVCIDVHAHRYSAYHYSHPPLVERLRAIDRTAAAVGKKAE